MIIEQFQFNDLALLESNFRANAYQEQNNLEPIDHWPVVRLYISGGDVSWLLSEYDPILERFYGIGDYIGRIELTSVTLDFFDSMQLNPVTVDQSFTPKASMMVYLARAYKLGRIDLNVILEH